MKKEPDRDRMEEPNSTSTKYESPIKVGRHNIYGYKIGGVKYLEKIYYPVSGLDSMISNHLYSLSLDMRNNYSQEFLDLIDNLMMSKDLDNIKIAYTMFSNYSNNK